MAGSGYDRWVYCVSRLKNEREYRYDHDRLLFPLEWCDYPMCDVGRDALEAAKSFVMNICSGAVKNVPPSVDHDLRIRLLKEMSWAFLFCLSGDYGRLLSVKLKPDVSYRKMYQRAIREKADYALMFEQTVDKYGEEQFEYLHNCALFGVVL